MLISQIYLKAWHLIFVPSCTLNSLKVYVWMVCYFGGGCLVMVFDHRYLIEEDTSSLNWPKEQSTSMRYLCIGHLVVVKYTCNLLCKVTFVCHQQDRVQFCLRVWTRLRLEGVTNLHVGQCETVWGWNGSVAPKQFLPAKKYLASNSTA